MTRLRDLGITIGLLQPGPLNAITDVAGVRVGNTTLIVGDGPLVVGEGPVRTGVTVIVPHDGDPWSEPVYAGGHVLNGNGEITGLEWIREVGLLTSPIAITNTHSVGVVRDALVARAVQQKGRGTIQWELPVVSETYDGHLNDTDGQHVRPEHVFAALDSATAGPVAEGNVGGGTGMICHEFKGGIGTSSRRLSEAEGGYTVGVLVQANYGSRARLAIDGFPVGRRIPTTEVPSPWTDEPPADPSALIRHGEGPGSCVIIVATDAPLLAHQCARLAQRAGLGLARTGGPGAQDSGDLFLSFATGNRGLRAADYPEDAPRTHTVTALSDGWITQLFWATIEATEEAIANALVAAETMTGRDGHMVHAIPHDRLREVMARYRDA